MNGLAFQAPAGKFSLVDGLTYRKELIYVGTFRTEHGQFSVNEALLSIHLAKHSMLRVGKWGIVSQPQN